VDDWRREPDDVPPAMAMSPGVAYNNKLWLIGGSCVNWKKTSSDVWCYEPLSDDPTLRAWRKKKTVGGDLPARMGHACIVTQANCGCWEATRILTHSMMSAVNRGRSRQRTMEMPVR
jgi:hypothetical protein